MNVDILIVLTWVMAISSGLMAGVYFTFSFVIMRSLAILEPANGLAAMNAINREILKSLFMPLFFGSTIVAALMIGVASWQWGVDSAAGALAAGLIYFIGMFVITATRNVPLNNRLDSVEGKGEEAEEMWALYLSRWTFWNTVRTVACTMTMLICIALLSS